MHLHAANLVESRLLLDTPAQRRQLVESIRLLTAHTWLAPSPYEERLLTEFVQGTCTMDEVLARLKQHEQGPGEPTHE